MEQPSPADRLHANLAETRRMLDAAAQLAEPLSRAVCVLRDALLSGGKLLCCGNGGSACDASHFTAEIVGRFQLERSGFPAIDLTANHGVVTALINDYPAEQVFAKQVFALGESRDVLIAFSTSGNSRNVLLALEAARRLEMKTIAFLGKGGGACGGLADVEFIAPATVTARVQECHLMLYHTICEALDPVLAAQTTRTLPINPGAPPFPTRRAA